MRKSSNVIRVVIFIGLIALLVVPEKKLIYSVGPGLKDSGGAGFYSNSKEYDLPFPIEF
jgi:hypothetical protein